MTKTFAITTFAFALGGGFALSALASTPASAMPRAASLAQAAPSEIVPVYHRGRPHRGARITVYPERYAGPYEAYPDYSYYYPRARGFEDYSHVRRGNMRGCTIDLGYGRYESCDK